MATDVSGINDLLSIGTSGLLSGGTVVDAMGGSETVSAFQGQLDQAMQQGRENESAGETLSVLDDSATEASDTSIELAAAEPSMKRPELAGKKDAGLSTIDNARVYVRKAKEACEDLETALEESAGTQFLSELKSFFLSLSNCDLDNISLDEDGLEALGDMLVQAGFDQAAVEELISDLTLTLDASNGTITVSEFMDSLFDLPAADEADVTEADVLMSTSDLPYIQSLLSMMGVDEEKISAIMDEVSQGTRGFNFEAFIEQLEQLFDGAEETGSSYLGSLFQTDANDDSYVTLLEQLGLAAFVEEDGPLTLSQLINAFEQKFDQQKEDLDLSAQADDTLSLFSDTGALSTDSGRQALLSQLLSGMQIQDSAQENIPASTVVTTGSDAMTQEIQDWFQTSFLNQVKSSDATTQSMDVDTELSLDQTNSLSMNYSAQKEEPSHIPLKITPLEAPVGETAGTGTSQQSGTSSGTETQTLVWGVETSTTTTGVNTSGTQKVHQALSTLPDFVTRQVGKSIVRAVSTGDDTIRMQLKPPELGRVYMSIDHSGNSMKVSVITEHQSAKDILTANVNEIKTILSSSGISLDSFDVDMSSDFRQSMADARAKDQSAGKRQSKDGSDGQSREADADNLTVQTADISDSGSLHFVA